MFTPQEVSEKVFPKSSFGSSGYNMASVDQFLDELTEDYTALYKDNATLKTKLKVLAEKVEEYRATEDAMRSTLLTAQRMAAKLVQEAEMEKERILTEARQSAAEEIAVLSQQTVQTQQKLQLAKQELAEFIQHSNELCQQQVQFLSTLPELDLAEVQAQKEEQVEETVQSIGEDIVASFETQEAAAPEEAPAEELIAEEPAVEEAVVEEAAAEEIVMKAPVAEEAAQEPVAEEPQQDEYAEAEAISFANDFKLDLDELKFGRNYSSEN